MSISGIVSGLWRISRRRVCVCGGGGKMYPDGRELSSVRIFAVAKIWEAGAGEILFISVWGYDPVFCKLLSRTQNSVATVRSPELGTILRPAVSVFSLAMFFSCQVQPADWCYSRDKQTMRVVLPADVCHWRPRFLGQPPASDIVAVQMSGCLIFCFRRAFIWMKSVSFFRVRWHIQLMSEVSFSDSGIVSVLFFFGSFFSESQHSVLTTSVPSTGRF